MLKKTIWSVQHINMLKVIVRGVQLAHMLKAMVRFVEKVVGGSKGYCPEHAKRVYFRNWYERQKVQRIEVDE
ncbi:3608_t:CDS:2 [Cetraspora pellucida]|uniref:3608_t:CDS:1 n=1 Tax=Cetraspora pellucida TaxID=1433469 RepID=A0A9N8WG92_9GLOM|nr:3608_t:CDS:2 [Cetraspora pellucida]